ncbi:MAG TPA: glycosyltransferase family A protein [Candidatus Cloacimonas sp.]|nr:glycosyltransferase family A protein [Candidatus Cloacimonas sp.]
MRIGALVRSYGLTDYLPAVLKSYSWVEKIIVMNYRFRGVKPREDKTPLIVRDFKNVVINSGENLNQHEAFNAGLGEFGGFDYVFIADADELIARQDQDRLIEGMSGHEAGTCKIIDYIGNFNERLPERTHKAIVIVKPSVRFYEVRCFAGSIKSFEDIYMHHFGYVYQPEGIAWKVEWEKKWEQGNIKHLLGQVHQPCTIPENISQWLEQ